ncbi:MAG: hypothetical protein H6679_05195 [Epsilonproteobacteria bacterium]|nr:hypothetical protein [Campylobacterota bacterium]
MAINKNTVFIVTVAFLITSFTHTLAVKFTAADFVHVRTIFEQTVKNAQCNFMVIKNALDVLAKKTPCKDKQKLSIKKFFTMTTATYNQPLLHTLLSGQNTTSMDYLLAQLVFTLLKTTYNFTDAELAELANTQDGMGNTLFFYLIKYAVDQDIEDPTFILNLLEYGAQPHYQTTAAVTPLTYALKNQDYYMSSKLATYNTQPITHLANNTDLIVELIYNGKKRLLKKVVPFLPNKQATLDSPSRYSYNGYKKIRPLLAAVLAESASTVRFLLEQGACPNFLASKREMLLEVALSLQCQAIICTLFDFNVSTELAPVNTPEEDILYAKCLLTKELSSCIDQYRVAKGKPGKINPQATNIEIFCFLSRLEEKQTDQLSPKPRSILNHLDHCIKTYSQDKQCRQAFDMLTKRFARKPTHVKQTQSLSPLTTPIENQVPQPITTRPEIPQPCKPLLQKQIIDKSITYLATTKDRKKYQANVKQLPIGYDAYQTIKTEWSEDNNATLNNMINHIIYNTDKRKPLDPALISSIETAINNGSVTRKHEARTYNSPQEALSDFLRHRFSSLVDDLILEFGTHIEFQDLEQYAQHDLRLGLYLNKPSEFALCLKGCLNAHVQGETYFSDGTYVYIFDQHNDGVVLKHRYFHVAATELV